MNFDVRNLIERAIWTFIQSAVGAISVVAVQAAILGVNLTGLRAIGLTALAAGIASVLSLAKNLTAEGLVVQSVNRTQAVMVEASARSGSPLKTSSTERYVTARLASDAGSQPAKRARKKPNEPAGAKPAPSKPWPGGA